ncbi:MAG: chorismate synthase, partial [Pseudomonadota bacterium]
PISLMIENVDQRSKDYSEIRDKYRPGHADFTYDAKYGVRDYRGGGRSSARETAGRVAAGAVAEKVLESVLKTPISISGYLIQIGKHSADGARFDLATIGDNPFWCPDPVAATAWETALDDARKSGSSMGGVIEVTASGVPAGLGAPIYGKLDSDLAAGLMSINAAKAVEIGAGLEAATLSGEENADEIRMDGDTPTFLTNNAGGILGGISTGQDIVARVAIKPTSSILTPRRSITKDGEEVDVMTKGRHDPCVAIRGAPVAAAMVACVLADHALMHRAQIG